MENAVFTQREFRRQRYAESAPGILVQTIAPASAALRAALQELNRLSLVMRQRSLPVSELAYRKTTCFLQEAIVEEDSPVPQILPVDDGGVLLEWSVGDLTYQLEFSPDGSADCGAFDARGNEIEITCGPMLSFQPSPIGVALR